MVDLFEVYYLSKTAYNFLKHFNPDEYVDGRYELSDGVYVNIESYETQERKNRKFESHERYIDIQYMITGEEIITVAPVSELKVSDQYNEERDITFYSNYLVGEDYLITSGTFLIIRPGEAHMPCVCVNGKQNIRKAVIKVPA